MSNQAIPILLYHKVPAGLDKSDPLSVPRERFAEHLDAVVASGRTPLTVDEIAAGLRGESALPKRVVAITFDDAYTDTPDAIELLLSRGLRGGVYVTVGQVGDEAMIAQEQLERLARLPEAVELGAHSLTHPHLDELSLAEIQREVGYSKRRLEETLGRAVHTFAYPYGSYDKRVRHTVIAAGYRSAAAVKNALSHPDDDPWALARWTVRGTTSADRIAQILDGRGAPLAWRHERLRTRSYRAVRRCKRRIGQGLGSWP